MAQKDDLKNIMNVRDVYFNGYTSETIDLRNMMLFGEIQKPSEEAPLESVHNISNVLNEKIKNIR